MSLWAEISGYGLLTKTAHDDASFHLPAADGVLGGAISEDEREAPAAVRSAGAGDGAGQQPGLLPAARGGGRSWHVEMKIERSRGL